MGGFIYVTVIKGVLWLVVSRIFKVREFKAMFKVLLLQFDTVKVPIQLRYTPGLGHSQQNL